jgi:hypothetical protein
VPADSAIYGRGLVLAAVRAQAHVSVTVRLDPKVKAAIATIGPHAWETIEYTDAILEETTGRWISSAESRRDRLHRLQHAEEDRPYPRAAWWSAPATCCS